MKVSWPRLTAIARDLFALVRSFSEENLIAVYFDLSTRNNTKELFCERRDFRCRWRMIWPPSWIHDAILEGNYICIWLWRAISLSEISTKLKSPPSCYNQYFRRHDNTAWISLSPRYFYLTAAENARLSKLICISNACDLSRQSARTGKQNSNSIEKKEHFIT